MDHRLSKALRIQPRMPTQQDLHFMQLAIEQARKGRQTPGGAEVGAAFGPGWRGTLHRLQ